MFPEEAVHCVEWARDRFGKFFEQQPAALLNEMKKASEHAGRVEVLGEGKSLRIAAKLIAQAPRGWADCVRWARERFEKHFHDASLQLLAAYPLGTTTNDGKLFWTLPKRAPKALSFDPCDALCASFVLAAATLRAREFGVALPEGEARGAPALSTK